MRHILRAAAVVVVASAALYACGGDSSGAPNTPSNPNTPNTPSGLVGFDQFQTQVLTPNCATSGCHVAPNPQAGLNLSEGASYANLINISPNNATATADGLKRVMPGKPDSSLLYHKLVFAPGHHLHDYGNVMPVGTGGVSNGQLEWVRQWILAGASRTAAAADGSLLADRTAQTLPPFAGLAAPAAGAGYQLKVDKFDVSANFERELFLYRNVGNASDVYVSRIETSMRPYSHHFVLYRFNPAMGAQCPLLVPQVDAVRDIRNPDGSMNFLNMLSMGCHEFFAGSMMPQSNYVFPDGMALRVAAGSKIDLNVHYANKTSNSVPGEAYVNLYTIPQAQVQHALSTLNLSNTNLSIPPGQVTTATKDFSFSATTTIIALTSHMHARGTKFEIWMVNAAGSATQKVYESNDWEHPPMVTFAQPLVIKSGEKLRSVVTYNNSTSKQINFGLTSDDEMDIIFGYYY
jgi:hypothetical protein